MFKDVTRLSLELALAIVPYGWFFEQESNLRPTNYEFVALTDLSYQNLREGIEPSTNQITLGCSTN